jgi:hypothetical protein
MVIERNNPTGNDGFARVNHQLKKEENVSEETTKTKGIFASVTSLATSTTTSLRKGMGSFVQGPSNALWSIKEKTSNAVTSYFSSNAQKTQPHDPKKVQVDQEILELFNTMGVEVYSNIIQAVQEEPSLIQKLINESYDPKHKVVVTNSKASFEITQQFQIDQRRQGFNITLKMPGQEVIIERSDDYVNNQFDQAVTNNWDQKEHFFADPLDKKAQTYATNDDFYFIDKEKLKSTVANNYPFIVAKQLENAFGKEWGYVAQVVGTQTLYNATVGYIAPLLNANASAIMNAEYESGDFPYRLHTEYSATITPVYQGNGKGIERLNVTINMVLYQVDNASNQATRSVSTSFKCELTKSSDHTPIFHAVGFDPLEIKHFF